MAISLFSKGILRWRLLPLGIVFITIANVNHLMHTNYRTFSSIRLFCGPQWTKTKFYQFQLLQLVTPIHRVPLGSDPVSGLRLRSGKVTSLGSDPVFCFRCLECLESQKGTQLNSHQLSFCNAFTGDEQAAKSAIRVRPGFRFAIAFWSARV